MLKYLSCSIILVTVSGLAVAVVTLQAEAVPITVPVVSTFDTGMDGWDDTGSSDISWQSSGGNPGGYIFFDDSGGAQFSKVFAPAKFLGDWSLLDGNGALTFDLRTIRVGTFTELQRYNVIIQNGSISAVWRGDVHSGNTSNWNDPETEFFVPIIESEWEPVSGGTWSDLLNNVTSLRIDLEQVTNTVDPRDQSGLDNVRLIPEPSTALLLGFGLTGLALRKKRIIC